MPVPTRPVILASIMVVATFLAGCTQPAEEADYVARVGSRTLTRADVERSLADQPFLVDSTEAAGQIIERWVSNELLYQDALDRGLQNEEATRRLLAENERSVLISALVNRLYEEELTVPDEAALRAYYDSHQDQLVLREPYVRVRILQVATATQAASARDSLAQIPADATGRAAFDSLAARASLNPEESIELADAYYPSDRLFAWIPGMTAALESADAGDILPILEAEAGFFIVQLIERIPVGAVPELAMIRDQIEERVRIEERKQLFARHVQRLRTRALARDRLDILTEADTSGAPISPDGP